MLQAGQPASDVHMFEASDYLDHMRALGAELESAMAIIARNSLVEFQESVARQEILTSRLAEISQHFALPEEGHYSNTLPIVNAEIAAQIRTANEHLQLLNRRYSALLRHSSRSVALMLSLFKSSKGYYRETSGSTLTHQTWSCRA